MGVKTDSELISGETFYYIVIIAWQQDRLYQIDAICCKIKLNLTEKNEKGKKTPAPVKDNEYEKGLYKESIKILYILAEEFEVLYN